MSEKLKKPDYIFETSWEICNKVGGIHTVVSTKALTLVKEYKDNLILIGPDVWRDVEKNPEFLEDKNLFKEWRKQARSEDVNLRIGRWNIVGKPIVFLIDFSNLIPKKDEIFKIFWEKYKLDSLSGQWDYIEPSIFGYVAGKAIESFYKYHLTIKERAIAHFHEWMTGTGILYLNNNVPQIATVFTTHATTVGRSIAGNGQPLYGELSTYNGDLKAKEFNIISKQSLEKTSAIVSDCFTTVSEITAKECSQFHEKDVDIVTPNGFEDNFVPVGDDFNNKRKTAQKKLIDVTEALLNHKLSDDVRFIATSGRYEFRNKGIDIFIDSLSKLNNDESVKKDIVAFILVPANNYGARKDLSEKLYHPEYNNKVDGSKYLTHGLHDAEYDPVLNRIQKKGLLNRTKDNVKIIFAPSYLNGDDGIFNIKYWDLLIGFDLSVFPSYYEPWGYTPLESLAFHIPTVTTDLAGFGRWIMKDPENTNDCIAVVKRTDYNHDEVVQNIYSIIKKCSLKTIEEKNIVRKNAYELSKVALWENLISYYKEAYHIALEKSLKRSKKFIKTYQIKGKIDPKAYKSNKPIWRNIFVKPKLTGKFLGLDELSKNLWWSWNNQASELFEYINPKKWNRSKQNPIALLKEVSSIRFQELENDEYFNGMYDKVYTSFKKYMNVESSKDVPKIAYFSMEYGINNSLKIYSGGLGILAGDYLKEASDSNINMVAVGLFYKYGYFRQQLSLQGEQQVTYEPQKFTELPAELVRDENGNLIKIEIVFPGRIVKSQVWKVNVGRILLYLLDTDIIDNKKQDRSISHHLYGGDVENRLKQEILLGIGGIRALNAIGINQDIYHCNEGHAALINIERLRNLISNNNFTFNESLEIIRSSSLFTTHTPVPAGHDSFSEDLVMTYMGHYPEKLNISWKQFIDLGKSRPGKAEKFSMSYLATNLSQEINGVSELHGKITRYMFNKLWDGYFPQELHIDYVTNGVHLPSWTADEWKDLYRNHLSEDFEQRQSDRDLWKKIYSVDNSLIWDIRNNQRKKLIKFIKNRLDSIWVKRHEDPKKILNIKNKLDEKTLTIGFARRFATYKRGDLLFRNPEKLAQIMNNPDMSVQFIFAGKAHPADVEGQKIIKRIIEFSKRPEFIGKIIFLENYDIELAKKLVQGVDIWLNTPTRPLEASGTSGMKAIMNGVLNFSVLDGWWIEGYKEGAGWALSEDRTYDNQNFQDELDAVTIYKTIETEIAPLYYDRNEKGVPDKWIAFVKKSIAEIAPEFTTKRMLNDYINKFYNKLGKRTEKIKANNYALAQNIASWKKKVILNWDKIEVVSINFSEPIENLIVLGEEYLGEVILDLRGISANDIGLELIISETKLNGDIEIINTYDIRLKKTMGSLAYFSSKITPDRPGTYNYGIRVFPKNEDLPNRMDFSYVKWI